MLKNEYKIRRMLDYKKYHLLTSDKMWALYRKYDNYDLYVSPNNKPIMTSETHTEKDLLKFARQHQIYDFETNTYRFRIIICFINLLIVLINTKLNSDLLIGVIFGICFSVMLEGLFDIFISNRNHKIKIKELKEKIVAMRNFRKD